MRSTWETRKEGTGSWHCENSPSYRKKKIFVVFRHILPEKEKLTREEGTINTGAGTGIKSSRKWEVQNPCPLSLSSPSRFIPQIPV